MNQNEGKQGKQGWKWWLWVILAAIAVFALVRVYYRATDDFRIANITHELPFHPEWETPPLSAADSALVNKILSQKFTYISKGAQSYAFESEDHKYVLKFFKFKHLRTSPFVEWLPPIFGLDKYKEKQRQRKAKNLNGLFDGYSLAYAKHKMESGLIFIHLNKTDNLYPSVTVVDKIGLERHIDLDPIVFIIQEKARTPKIVINELLEKGDVIGAKSKLQQLIALYLAEYKKGIYDHDHGVMHNTGFVGDRPIHLDVGKLGKDETMKQPAVAKRDMDRILQKFDAWLTNNYPQYKDQIMPDLQETARKGLEGEGER